MRRVLVVVALAACDPMYRIEGVVADSTGKPIAGVTVNKTCPSSTQEATTDERGAFGFGGVGGAFEADRCTLTLAKPGYAARTVPPTAVCYRNTRHHDIDEPCANRKVVLERDVTP
jgi:hypothetical protein